MKKINPLIQWWVTPKLPREDVFEKHNFISQWIIHPIKRRLAKVYLKILQKYTDIIVIGLTGSAGKSTTVQMITSVLGKVGRVVSTPPSIDPVYNIPNTILKTPFGTKFLILEVSVEYRNEMDYYLWLAKVNVGVIINIYPTHTQFFKDVKGVMKEKSKLVKSLNKKDTAILNSENKYTKEIADKVKAKVIYFGDKGNIKAKNVVIKDAMSTEYTLVVKKNKISVRLPVAGMQFVENSLAAASIAHVLGIDIKTIKKGLESYKKPKHRMRPIKHKSGALILDDSYNNNPEAAIAAIDTLCEVAEEGTKVVVMGDMLELGDLEEKEHRRVGKYIVEKGIDSLIGVGKASKLLIDQAEKKLGKDNVFWVPNQKKVYPLLQKLLKQNTTVLIKGSRSIELDKLIKRLS